MTTTTDLSGLVAFLEVADRKSFSAAAAHLGVTPSAISQTIKQLEDRLGARLLHRTTRSVGLTEAGERFVARVRPAVGELREAMGSLDAARDRPSGTLRLNLSRVACALVIEPVLRDLLDAHPDLSVELSVDDGLADIVAAGFDAGIRLGETVDRGMIAVKLGGDLRTAIVGAPSYFAAHKRPRRASDLLEHDCIRYRRVTSGAIYQWELLEDGKEIDIAVSGRVIVNEVTTMVRAAKDGLGLAHVIEESVRGELASGALVEVMRDASISFPGFHLYYPTRAQVPAKVRALIDLLKRRKARGRSRG